MVAMDECEQGVGASGNTCGEEVILSGAGVSDLAFLADGMEVFYVVDAGN